MIDKNTLYCSFCGKSQHEVKKLIAGPTVFICDECAILCILICLDEDIGFANVLDPNTIFSAEIMRELEKVTVSSFEELCTLTGQSEREGPYTVLDIFTVLVKGLDALVGDAANRRIAHLEQHIAQREQESQKELDVLRSELARLKEAKPPPLEATPPQEQGQPQTP